MRNKKCYMYMILALAFVAAGAMGHFILRQTPSHEPSEELFSPPDDGNENMVMAAGVTSAGIIEKELDLGFLETDLLVDEIYVSAYDTVEIGQKMLAITDSSLREAERELERAKMEASLAYRQGVIDYEIGKLEAENTRKKRVMEADFAQVVYDDTIAEAEAEVRKAEKAVEDAQEIVDEYTAAIEADYYYTEYEIEEKKAAYEKNMALFFEKLDDYGYELDDDDDDDPNTYHIVKKESRGNSPDSDGESTVLQLLKSEYQEDKEAYDQALADYEAALEKAKAGIAEATDTMQLKQLAWQEALIALEKTKVSAQADYDICVINGENADDAYETEWKRLAEELEILRDAEAEAEENQALFLETIGDGCLYAECAGMILMMRAAENTVLPLEGMILAYSNTDEMMVTVSVDQSDIARISIGDPVSVVAEGYETCSGTVSEIDPVSASTGHSSAGYAVTVCLDDDSGLPANLTVAVYFGQNAAGEDER